jgi:hypothetical protein
MSTGVRCSTCENRPVVEEDPLAGVPDLEVQIDEEGNELPEGRYPGLFGPSETSSDLSQLLRSTRQRPAMSTDAQGATAPPNDSAPAATLPSAIPSPTEESAPAASLLPTEESSPPASLPSVLPSPTEESAPAALPSVLPSPTAATGSVPAPVDSARAPSSSHEDNAAIRALETAEREPPPVQGPLPSLSSPAPAGLAIPGTAAASTVQLGGGLGPLEAASPGAARARGAPDYLVNPRFARVTASGGKFVVQSLITQRGRPRPPGKR